MTFKSYFTFSISLILFVFGVVSCTDSEIEPEKIKYFLTYKNMEDSSFWRGNVGYYCNSLDEITKGESIDPRFQVVAYKYRDQTKEQIATGYVLKGKKDFSIVIELPPITSNDEHGKWLSYEVSYEVSSKKEGLVWDGVFHVSYDYLKILYTLKNPECFSIQRRRWWRE